MNALISVITPVGEHADPTHLDAAFSSLTAQILPPDVEWEWLLQLDCAVGGPELPDAVCGDRRVRVGRNRRAGPGVARTTALARAAGETVANLDADDRFAPHALADAHAVFAGDDTIGWTTSPVIDLLADGSTRRWDHDPPAGRLRSGSVTAGWTDTYTLAVHPSTLVARRTLLIALGGWMALPVSEDLGLLVALDTVADGWFHARPGLIRRTHPGQMTRDPIHDNDKSAFRAFIAQRAAALDDLRRATPPLADRRHRQ